jgi:hypothetical protein
LFATQVGAVSSRQAHSTSARQQELAPFVIVLPCF